MSSNPGPRREKLWIGLFFLGTIVFAGILAVLGGGLRTPAAPHGILTLEFAGSDTCGCGLFSVKVAADSSCVSGILESWSDRLALVWWHLILDYGLMISYGGLLFLTGRSAARALGDARRPLLRTIALAGAAFGVAAALADVVENLLLLRMVGDSGAYGLAPEATPAARIKFGLLIASVAALLVAGSQAIFGRARLDDGRPAPRG